MSRFTYTAVVLGTVWWFHPIRLAVGEGCHVSFAVAAYGGVCASTTTCSPCTSWFRVNDQNYLPSDFSHGFWSQEPGMFFVHACSGIFGSSIYSIMVIFLPHFPQIPGFPEARIRIFVGRMQDGGTPLIQNFGIF